MVDRLFLDYSVQKLRQAAGRVDECLARLTEDQVWARGAPNENAPGNLVLHLCGNVRQWVISGVGRSPNTRDRDAEFAADGGMGTSDLRRMLRQTVEEAVPVIERQTAEQLEQQIQVQNYRVAVLEAIYHVVEHFAGHAGQIIFVTKALTGEDLGFYKHLKYSAHREQTP
ncbi:MAG: DUF1572 domain-containing protein [Acidobacteriota bacterium]|nr:DUF1572 domain-containing protein [Acidobacteriota bacterium]